MQQDKSVMYTLDNRASRVLPGGGDGDGGGDGGGDGQTQVSRRQIGLVKMVLLCGEWRGPLPNHTLAPVLLSLHISSLSLIFARRWPGQLLALHVTAYVVIPAHAYRCTISYLTMSPASKSS